MLDHNNTEIVSELRTVISRLVKKLRSKSPSSLSLSLTSRSTLFTLGERGKLLPTELAAMEKVTAQSMSQILNNLDSLGYITRDIEATDKRKTIISLSQQGQDILQKMRQERDEWLTRAMAQVCAPSDWQTLRDAIGPLKRIVDFD